VVEGGRNGICNVVGVDVVLTRGAENPSGADNRSWEGGEDAASLFDVSVVGRHSALAKPSSR